MLVLDRFPGEGIIINDCIQIVVEMSDWPNQVDLKIRAPKHIPVYRAEIYARIKKGMEDKVKYKKRKLTKEINANDGT